MASSAECMSVLRQQRNVVSKNSSPVSSAASVPVEKKTFLLWAATWETALAMFDPVLTARKSTLSLRTRSLARRVATSGFSSLSPVTSSILRPSTPPAALSRSAPNRKPATLASPMYATGPLRGSTIPILIGPVCDHPRRVVAKGPAAATPAAATPLRKRLRLKPMPWIIADSFLDLEILSPHRVTGRQLPGAPAEHDLPLGHDVHPLRQRERRLHGLLHHQHRGAAPVDLAQDPLHLFHDHRSEPFGGLVNQEHLRVAHEGAPDRQHLLLPARQRPRALPLALAKTREELIDALERPAAVARGGALDAHQQVLLHRDRREDPALLRHVADPEPRDPVRWEPRDAGALERHRPT